MFSGDISDNGVAGGAYVAPALVKMPGQTAPIETETFAPILYVIEYETLEMRLDCKTRCHKGCHLASLRWISLRRKLSCPLSALIAVLQM